LQTDRIDLVQHHEVIRFEDPHRIFDDDGANSVLVEARKAIPRAWVGQSCAGDQEGGNRT